MSPAPTRSAKSLTVTLAVPGCPSLVAVIVADPEAMPLTKPVPLTVARLGSLLVHVTRGPVTGLPLPSLRVAVNCRVDPMFTFAEAGSTVTVATVVA